VLRYRRALRGSAPVACVTLSGVDRLDSILTELLTDRQHRHVARPVHHAVAVVVGCGRRPVWQSPLLWPGPCDIACVSCLVLAGQLSLCLRCAADTFRRLSQPVSGERKLTASGPGPRQGQRATAEEQWAGLSRPAFVAATVKPAEVDSTGQELAAVTCVRRWNRRAKRTWGSL
jgi:hypothetical protein